jgi:hypothetical protein
MSLFGKLLAIFNVLVAIAFFCVAILDYSQRKAWSYAVLRAETLIEGLPLDENEVNVDGDARYQQLNDKSLSEIFSPAGGSPQRTVLSEVRRVKGIIDGYLTEKPDVEAVRKELVEGQPAEPNTPASPPVLQTKSQRLAAQIFQLERESALEKNAKQPRADVIAALSKQREDLLKNKGEIDADIQAFINNDPAAKDKLEQIAQRRKFAALLFPFASSSVEFEELMDDTRSSEAKPLGDLQDKLAPLFDSVIIGNVAGHKLNVEERKLAAARLLFNLIGAAPKTGYEVSATGLQRVIVVCGLANTAHAIDAQAEVYRKMAEDMAYVLQRDQSGFVTEQYRVVGKAQDLADELRKQQLYWHAQEDLVSKQTDLVTALKNNFNQLKDWLKAAQDTTQEKLQEQKLMEDSLFDARKQLRDTQMLNQKREQQIRELEKAKGQ